MSPCLASVRRWGLTAVLFALPLALTPFLHRLPPIFHDHSRESMLLLLASSTLLVLGLGLRGGGRLAVAVVTISVPLTYAALRSFARLGGRPPAGDAAIGYALYYGYPKSLEMFQIPLLVVVPGLIALFAVYLRKRGGAAVVCDSRETQTTPWIGALILGLLAIGLACYFVPDLASTCPTTATNTALGWDSNNFLVWRYLLHTGAKPFCDFWYPYSGQMLFDLAFPRGEIILALHRFTLFTVLLLAVYLNAEKSLPATLGVFGAIFGLYVGGFFEWPERYGSIVNVILTYTAIDRSVRRWQGRHVLFWIAVVQAVVIEPTSVLYAGGPLFAGWVLEAVRTRADFLKQLPWRLCREFAAPAAILSAVGLYLAVRGELMGFLAFMASLGTQAAYGAYPTDIRTWLHCAAPAESFVIWSVVVLIGVGLVRHFRHSEPDAKEGRILCLLGIAGAMLLLKQIVRPHMAGQILIVDVAGILFYLFACRKTNAWQWGGAVFAAGLLFANLAASPVPQVIRNQIVSTAARVRASAPYWTLHGSQRRALTAMRFAPERFRLTEEHRAAVFALLKLARTEDLQPLFVLSDDPIFYILAGERPYFHTNGYNAAPIQEQKHMLRLLEANPPRIVVWRCADAGVDNVPPVVRDPLLYEYVIFHYVPDASTPPGAYALLRRRRTDEPIAVDFWRQRLGAVLQLGHIPRFSSMARFRGLQDRPGEEIAEFLTVKITDAAAVPPPSIPELPAIGGYRPKGRSLLIPIECGGRRFAVALSIVPGQSEYHVLLNRVWFWGPLRKAGFTPTLGNPGPGVEASIERRAMNEDILY